MKEIQMFTWKKKGLILEPAGFDWMVTHAQNPFQEHVSGSLYKIHFAGRDKFNQARGGYALIDFKEPQKILEISQKPTLDLGELGTFDDSGAMPSSIVDYNGLKYMYYTGWTQARKVPFFFFIGLTISRDGGRTYKRHSQAPVLGRTSHDPFLTAAPWVIKEGSLWKMWYVSATGWELEDNVEKVKHYYHIKYAESKDGINWVSEGVVCIDFNVEEYAIARPIVYKEEGLYKMWYCYRGGTDTYRAGYAESEDGKAWERKDNEVGIDVSPSGWDSEMICYPCVFKDNGTYYMLYNGNSYGSTGIGLAVLED
ncbi:MAG: hypothetical protein ACE5EZ_03185 [Thermodesulfobacteriota bacterium]